MTQRNDEDKAIFDVLVESGIIETGYDAFLVGIGVGRATERNKEIMGK